MATSVLWHTSCPWLAGAHWLTQPACSNLLHTLLPTPPPQPSFLNRKPSDVIQYGWMLESFWLYRVSSLHRVVIGVQVVMYCGGLSCIVVGCHVLWWVAMYCGGLSGIVVGGSSSEQRLSFIFGANVLK